MNTERDTTRIVRSWLEDGVTVLPDRVLDSVLDQLPATHQRRSRWPAWRIAKMNQSAKLGIAAAAVLVVALIGYQYLPSSSFGSPDATASAAPPTQTPVTTPTPRPSFLPGEASFTSTVHGISTGYPAGWQVRPATAAWTGGALSFDSPSADVIFDPTLGDRLYFILASQPDADGEPSWGRTVDGWQCPNPSGSGPAGRTEPSGLVDGAQSMTRDCEWNHVATLIKDGRGYLIELVVSSLSPSSFRNDYDYRWFRSVLDTVKLHPEGAVDGPSASDPPFAQGTYANHGFDISVDARGTGPTLAGTITVGADEGRLAVQVECTGTTVEGFLAVAGTVKASTFVDWTPVGSRFGLAFKPGPQIEAMIYDLGPGLRADTCEEFILILTDGAQFMEPIQGTLELAP